MLLPGVVVPTLMALAEPPMASSDFFSKLAMHRGALLLVEAPPEWNDVLESRAIRDRLARVLVTRYRLQDPVLRRLGIGTRGVYALDRAGRTLRFFPGGPPADVQELLDALGWVSSAETLKRFIREHPQRLDARWALLNETQRILRQEQSEATLQQCAEALESLLNQEFWFQGSSGVFMHPVRPEGKVPKDNPLARLAMERWSQVVDGVARDPGHLGAWSVLAFLSVWHPESPWLYRIVLEAPPLGDEPKPDWPEGVILDLCERQLREAKHWRGMAEFAERRLAEVEAYQASFHPDSLGEWSGTAVVTPTKVERPTWRERLGRQAGRWYLLAFEAAVEEGRLGEAQSLAQRIVALGDAGIQTKAKALATRRGHASLVEALEVRK